MTDCPTPTGFGAATIDEYVGISVAALTICVETTNKAEKVSGDTKIIVFIPGIDDKELFPRFDRILNQNIKCDSQFHTYLMA